VSVDLRRAKAFPSAESEADGGLMEITSTAAGS
jgi:hypothetical protein